LVLTLLTVLGFVANPVLASVANITQVAFTTPARSVAVSAVSESLTVQTQNSAGTSEQLDETADITLSSSSATGDFSSSATTWAPDTTLTMSKNSSNRTFYYKDTVDGTYTITATLLTRTTLRTWTTTQTIVVGTGGSGGGNAESPIITTATSTTATSTIASSISASTSAHSGGSSIAKDPEPKEFEIFGGRDRLTVVGAPVVFQAKVALIKNVSNPTRYLWSFGDGSVHDGIKTEHTYLFPGEYVVVLNAEAFEGNAVWRGVVKVVAPELLVDASTAEYIEIWNRSGFEINLNNWVVKNGQESFTFPIDTIIPARKKVAFPYQITKVTSGPNVSVNLHNPSAKIVAHWQAPVVAQATTTASVAVAANLGIASAVTQSSLDTIDVTYKKALALSDEWSRERGAIAESAPAPKIFLTKNVVQSENTVARYISNVPSAEKSKSDEISDSNQTASVITILPEVATSTSRGFIDTLISWPGRSLRFMRDLVF
jgi:PKD domain